MPEELSGFSECFITGTAAEVTAVSEIADWKFTPGAHHPQLMRDYTAKVQPEGQGRRGVSCSAPPRSRCATGSAQVAIFAAA